MRLSIQIIILIIIIVLVEGQTGATKNGVAGTVGIAIGFAVCVCIMVGLAIKVHALKKSHSFILRDDQAKTGKQYAEKGENQPPAVVLKEMVVIENDNVIGDDLIMSKSKQADVFL